MFDFGFFPAVAGHAHAWILDWRRDCSRKGRKGREGKLVIGPWGLGGDELVYVLFRLEKN